MKIAVAQVKSIKGDILGNIDRHIKLIELTISYEIDIIIFPELSITGYEPKLAAELAMHQDDSSLNDFQKLSDAGGITIGIGVPIKHKNGICIGMVIFQPNKARQTYLKKYIHPDEEPFFISGENDSVVLPDNIALAICYELSVPEHSLNAFNTGAKIYIASVAKSITGHEVSSKILSDIAAKYSMNVLMANSIGHCEDFVYAGKTSAWDSKGILVEQLDDINEGIIFLDTKTNLFQFWKLID